MKAKQIYIEVTSIENMNFFYHWIPPQNLLQIIKINFAAVFQKLFKFLKYYINIFTFVKQFNFWNRFLNVQIMSKMSEITGEIFD